MGGELSRTEAEALETALTYFRNAAPHHTADEERDLFPALVERLGSTQELERLEAEHRRADELHAAVDQIGLAWLKDGILDPAKAGVLLSSLQELESLYQEHIRIEEDTVFPRASACLPADVLLSIGRRMATRRGVAYIPDTVVSIGER
jgi:hemerythrin-like domain-containing protein